MKHDVLNKISRVINYEESERVRLNVYVDQLGDQQEEYLLIGEELILRLDNKIRKITFDEIKEINVSMCSRLYNPGIVESNLEKLIIKRWTYGSTLAVGQHLNYYVDLDIILDDEKIMIEAYSLKNIVSIIEILSSKGITINDPLKIKDILTKGLDDTALEKYLDNHFHKLAKEYNLDNPRGIIIP